MKSAHRFILIGLCFLIFVIVVIAFTDIRLRDFQSESDVDIFQLDFETYKKHASFFPPHHARHETKESFEPHQPLPSLDNTTLKFYALYFPQWYPTAENGWGYDWMYFEGTPLIENANQIPIFRPKNHVYYDPRHYITRLTQRNLAQKYGIDGFIFYHYWYDQPFLADVVELMLHDNEPAMSFAFLWVNEEFGPNQPSYRDPLRHALYLSRFMKHPKYIRINHRPLLYLYHAKLIPLTYLTLLEEHLIHLGVQKPYLIQCLQMYGGNMDLLPHMDSYAEFPPNIIPPDEIRTHPTNSFQLGLSLNYDNTPRVTRGVVIPGVPLPNEPTKGRIISNALRDKEIISKLCQKKIQNWYPINQGPKVVIIFAWNEWSEQAVLEPSDILNYQLLEAVKECRLTWNASEESPQLPIVGDIRTRPKRRSLSERIYSPKKN